MNIPQYKKRNLDETKLGDRLTILRLNAGYTQETVAELLFMDSKAYGKYERETAKPSIETIVTLAKLYNVSTDYILRGIETSPFEKLSTNAPSKPENGTVSFANGTLQINWGASKGDIWHYNVHLVKEGEQVSYLNMLGETFSTSYSFAPQFKGVYYLIIQPESNQGVYGQALKLKVELN